MPEPPIEPTASEVRRKHPSAGKRRTLTESVTVHSMPPGLALLANKNPPTIAICLQVPPAKSGIPHIISCSIAANFGAQNLKDGGQVESSEEIHKEVTDRDLPCGTTVAVIRPVATSGLQSVWRPSLGQVVAYALREMSVSPAQLCAQPIVLALHAVLPTVHGIRGLFRQLLPECRVPKWLRLRVPDFDGRVFAISAWTVDISPIPGEDGNLNTLARVLEPTLKRLAGAEEATHLNISAEALSLEKAAREARLALYLMLEVHQFKIGGYFNR